MKIICISDTHNLHKDLKVPDGDILIHAGDMTCVGGIDEIIEFNEWLGTLPHRHKIVIAGNHDIYFEEEHKEAKSLINNAIYLEDSGIIIEGLKIWGSPISPIYLSPTWAFNRKRGEPIRKHWDLIPTDTDILITHCPPFGILDFDPEGRPKGCEDLLGIVQHKIKPRLHVFGHLHDAHGQVKIGETLFVNASIVNTVNYPDWLKLIRKLAIRVFNILKNILPTKKPIRLNRKAYESQIEVVFGAVEITYQQK